jgi:hypothetical protein
MKIADVTPEISSRDYVTGRELSGIEMNNGHGEMMVISARNSENQKWSQCD